MKYRLIFPRPRRADATILPAAVAAILAAMLVLQFVVPRQLTLPEPGVVHPFALAPARPTPLVPDTAILGRPLLAPAAAGSIDVADAPVGGATALGILTRGGVRTGFVQAPDGRVTSLSPGAAYRGWRLAAVGTATLVFRRGAETATLTVGARPASPPPSATDAGQR